MQTKQVKPTKPEPVPKTEPVKVPQYIPQKAIRNECLQSLEIYFRTESGEVDTHWLLPKETIKIPSAGVTPQLKLLHERRMIKMRDV